MIDLLGETYACGHLNASANYKQPGWAYLSINKDLNDIGANGNPMGYELIAVRLDRDGNNVRRIVHPHNTGDDNWLSAFAVPNPDGTLLMFNSTWGSMDESTVNAYMSYLTAPYSLTTVTKGNGNVTTAANGLYFEGTQVKIKAIPDWGFEFIKWEGDTTTTENPITITVDSNINLTAVFTDATGILNPNDNSSKTELKCFPNPSNGPTNIYYVLKKKSNVKVSVFTVSGSQVAVLLNGKQSVGKHSIKWNGLSNTGTKINSGIYIVQLLIDNKQESRCKIIVN